MKDNRIFPVIKISQMCQDNLRNYQEKVSGGKQQLRLCPSDIS